VRPAPPVAILVAAKPTRERSTMERGKLDLQPTDDGYILIRTTADGLTQSMLLSNLEVMELAQSATSLRAGILARLQPSGTGAIMVVTAVLEKFRADMDSLEESVLLEMRTPNGGQIIYTIVPTTARLIAQELERVVNEMETKSLPQ
jgi:hypothetical protein